MHLKDSLVYLIEPTTTFGGIIHVTDQPFFVLSYDHHLAKVDLALVPGGTKVLTIEVSKTTTKKPPVTVYDFILED